MSDFLKIMEEAKAAQEKKKEEQAALLDSIEARLNILEQKDPEMAQLLFQIFKFCTDIALEAKKEAERTTFAGFKV